MSDDGVLNEAIEIIDDERADLLMKSILAKIVRVGVTLDSFAQFMRDHTQFSEEWIENAATIVFKNIYPERTHES